MEEELTAQQLIDSVESEQWVDSHYYKRVTKKSIYDVTTDEW